MCNFATTQTCSPALPQQSSHSRWPTSVAPPRPSPLIDTTAALSRKLTVKIKTLLSSRRLMHKVIRPALAVPTQWSRHSPPKTKRFAIRMAINTSRSTCTVVAKKIPTPLLLKLKQEGPRMAQRRDTTITTKTSNRRSRVLTSPEGTFTPTAAI